MICISLGYISIQYFKLCESLDSFLNLKTTLGQRLQNFNNNVAFLMLLGTTVNAQPISIFLKFKFCCIQCSQSKQTGVLALKVTFYYVLIHLLIMFKSKSSLKPNNLVPNIDAIVLLPRYYLYDLNKNHLKCSYNLYIILSTAY